MVDKMIECGLFGSLPKSTDKFQPQIIDSQIISDTAQISLRPESCRLVNVGKESGKASIRKIQHLIPSAFPWARAVSRQLKANVENTMYIYPTQFERVSSQ
jgi:hypothetical protein